MCASYGLDPRFTDTELIDEIDDALLDELRSWARENDDETLRPTGRNLRNLNPLLVSADDGVALEPAWWGYLVDGAPAKFPSINTRSERLVDRPGGLRSRAIVPATGWFEMQKPSRVWHEFLVDDGALFGMAAVTQRGRTAEGDWHTCYSIVMRPAPEHLAGIHDRVPLLLPASLGRDWLSAPPTREIIDEALAEAEALDKRISAVPKSSDKRGADQLF
ncbi:SOS response-associated peptidase family protein [Streptomyces sp. AC495_CC817]|uniref:SOS response-associated peptidase family protein n=1 Tax=Streptomyces sp. AC495_CC817 TaxID=2823900 RepID=UPI001C27875D|nr:SOS response-associated peptidase family protein [Streptomyces sp. AC495_CC817]